MSSQHCDVCGTPMPVVRKPANWRQALWGGWTCPGCHSEFDRWGRNMGVAGLPRTTFTLDNTSFASNPGQISLSDKKLRVLRPDLFTLRQRIRELLGLSFPQRTYLREHLQNGDSRAAAVVSTDPLLVAAYTEELDCVVMLEFPDHFVEDYGLKPGTKLLTVNTYRHEDEIDSDLIPGPDAGHQWSGLHPIIAEFVSDDEDRIKRRKKEISQDEWRRACQLGRDYLKARPGVMRDGRPVHAGRPADWKL